MIFFGEDGVVGVDVWVVDVGECVCEMKGVGV